MRLNAMFLLSVFLFLLFLPTRLEATVLFSDDFESGTLAKWVSGGNWKVTSSAEAAHGGAKGADIFGPTNLTGDVLMGQIPTLGQSSLMLNFWAKVRAPLDSDGDQILVEWTAGADNWQILADFSRLPAGVWEFVSLPLPVAANNNPDFGWRFRVIMDDSSGSDRWALDDVSLVPEPAIIPSLVIGLFVLTRRK